MTTIPVNGKPVPAVRIPRWEYMTMTYSHAYGSTTYEVNGAKDGSLKNVQLYEVLNQFGQQGWELFTIAGADGKQFVFKRPLVKLAETATGG